MKKFNQSNRFLKRPRTSDDIQNQIAHPSDDQRAKRSRLFSDGDGEVGKDEFGQLITTSSSPGESIGIDQNPLEWSLSQPLAGQFSNLDPVFTLDEEYVFIGLDTAVHAYSVATSCLFRIFQPGDGHRIVGYKLSPIDQAHLYIFTSAGSVSKWEWISGKEISRWNGNREVMSVDSAFYQSENDTSLVAYSVQKRKDGKREVTVLDLGDGRKPENVALETHTRISDIKVARQGRVIVAYGGPHIAVGTANARQSDVEQPIQYTWREVSLPTNITCLDVRESEISTRRGHQGIKDNESSDSVDLVVGEADGSILIYHDIMSIFLCNKDGGKGSAPRRLHWHRGLVSAIRWSKDGNYVISGGNEPVMVLWQLDTGRKQFLPHLPSPICNIVVSPTGTLYGLKLADNSTIVLSARELQPHATITGLQLRAKVYRPGDPSRKKSRHPLRAMPAALHPRHPDQLLIAVPTGETSEGSHRQLNSSVIQTYDIRTNSHISRQAVARTNATSLQVGPGGSEIGTPDVTHFDVSQDGKWMATIDAWRRPSQDANSKSAADHLEIFLKFWRWSKDTSLWQLVTRIDGPHFLDENPVPVLALGCRPHTHEFVTVGADAVLRFWCPTARQRTGLNSKPDAEEKSETWKCRSIIDLPGPIGCSKFKPLGSASVAFSEDGSVLSVCLPSLSATKPGISLIIDAQKYVVHYSRIGLYSGNPYASKFLGRHLIVASSQSVSAWDTVNDLVRSTRLSDLCPTSSPLASRLLAVNPKTWTLAVATQCPPGNQPCNIESHVQVYDAVSLKLLSQPNLGCCPLALLPDPRSGGYIIIDAAASLRKLGSLDKKASHTIYSSDRTIGLNAGLTKHLSSQVHDGYPQVLPQADLDKIPESHTKGLGDVFDVPSFAMPPASVLFRDVVQSLLAR